MRVSRRKMCVTSIVAAMCLSPCVAAAQPHQPDSKSDQVAAERVLGPQWKQLSRRAGMIFSGTVLRTSAPGMRVDHTADRTIPAIELSFRVERAIAGVEPGQVLAIHEWAGAWAQLRPLHQGDRVLLFLYPPSRLGLTSPVGGSQGQIRLDAAGQYVLDRSSTAPIGLGIAPHRGSAQAHEPTGTARIPLTQIERAIRSARQSPPDRPSPKE